MKQTTKRETLKKRVGTYPRYLYIAVITAWLLAPNIAWRIGSLQHPDGWASDDFGAVIWLGTILYVGYWPISVR